MFRKVVDGEVEMVVDDILAHAKDQSTTERFAAEFGRKFKLKDMGDIKYYMGCHITRGRKTRKLKLDQDFYMKSIVLKFGFKKTSRILASSGLPTLSKADDPHTAEEKEDMSEFPYREAMGALM